MQANFKSIQENILPISGRVDEASATESGDSGSIPGRVKSNIIKIDVV